MVITYIDKAGWIYNNHVFMKCKDNVNGDSFTCDKGKITKCASTYYLLDTSDASTGETGLAAMCFPLFFKADMLSNAYINIDLYYISCQVTNLQCNHNIDDGNKN